MNRCVTCRSMLRFYGISQSRDQWTRWTVCPHCGLFHKYDDFGMPTGLTRTEPPKTIFRTT